MHLTWGFSWWSIITFAVGLFLAGIPWYQANRSSKKSDEQIASLTADLRKARGGLDHLGRVALEFSVTTEVVDSPVPGKPHLSIIGFPVDTLHRSTATIRHLGGRDVDLPPEEMLLETNRWAEDFSAEVYCSVVRNNGQSESLEAEIVDKLIDFERKESDGQSYIDVSESKLFVQLKENSVRLHEGDRIIFTVVSDSQVELYQKLNIADVKWTTSTTKSELNTSNESASGS